MSVWDSGV